MTTVRQASLFDDVVRVPSARVLAVVMGLYMVVGFVVCFSMLKWAVDLRLGNPDPVLVAEVDPNTAAETRERHLKCLAKNIYYEAATEPFEGKVAVAQVTLNRVNSGLFPDDLCRVIFQKNVVYQKVICQFSWACDKETVLRPVNGAAYRESMEVAKRVLLEGFRLPSLSQAMYYHATYVNPGWRKEKIVQIGNHIFYK